MARNGSGTYSLPEAPYTPNTTIASASVNANLADIATALSDSIAKDGQTTPTANLPMGGFKHTGVADASARNHYAAAGQVQDGALHWGGTAAGTANARTITLTPAITAYAAGLAVEFLNGNAANTGACTLAVSGLAATAIRKGAGATDLAAGDLPADALVRVVHDGTVFRLASVQPAGIGVSLIRAASAVIDRGYAEYTAAQSLAAQIPYDDTIPQSTEGTQILSVTITPKSTTSRIRVRFQGAGATSVAAAWTVALFDGGANAIAANYAYVSTATVAAACSLEFEHVPGSTSPRTYTIRVGPDRAANLTFNGLAGASATRVFGGVARGATLVVEEIAA